MATQQDIAALIIRLVGRTDQLQSSLDQSQNNIAKFASFAKKAFAALGVGVAIKQFVDLINETTKLADESIKTAQRLGTTVETLTKYRYAAKLSGVSTGELTAGLRRFSANLYDAYNGLGEAKNAFDELDLTTEKLSNPDGSMRSLESVFEAVGDELSQLEDGARKSAIAQDIFGRSGAALIPLFNQGAEGLRAMSEEAENFGVVIGTDMAQSAERFRDNLARLSSVWGGLKILLVQELLPVLNSVTSAMVFFARVFWGVSEETIKTLDNLGKTTSESFDKIGAGITDANKKIEEAKIADHIATQNRILSVGLAELEQKYRQGMVSVREYYDLKKRASRISTDAEVEALKKLSAATEDEAERIKIQTEIEEKLAAHQKNRITLAMEEYEAQKEFSEKIKELLEPVSLSDLTASEREQQEIEERYNSILSQLESFSDKKIEIDGEYYEKKAVLDELNHQKSLQLAQMEADEKRAIKEKELIFQQSISGQISSLAGQIYSESNKQLEAFFYIQKAAAVAQAYINTSLAATKAMAETSGGVLVQTAASRTIWALGLANIGIILSQALAGPKKMEMGGLVTGGSGVRDDVPILGMRDEYMMNQQAVKHYGVGFMNAINSMRLPRTNLSTLMGVVPATSSYNFTIPVNVDSPALQRSLKTGIENTVVKIMREYAR